ncbi:hypothetical protein J437_LFUL017099 [Ladona fulva]|uniref:POPDC1-3 domain-containing protein n=1 Tax=Ladona fulva TaxID=123851 RepID=A0A8K0KIK9_LADFU|nr:hypothetical protein J437_LFUL017099 [Ladona fulva]
MCQNLRCALPLEVFHERVGLFFSFQVYLALFQPLKVTRHQFKKVLDCMKGIRHLKYQEVYAQEKVTKVESLSLVLSGKHIFIHQVSITAMEESRVLIWHRDKLKLTIITDQFLQAVFDHILGRDVVKKLMQVSRTGRAEPWPHGTPATSPTPNTANTAPKLLVVSQNGRALHIVFPHQFLDSPEWFGVSTDEFFQVSITAMEESRVLIWHRDKLKLTIITDQFLQAVFDHILGRDVVKKLMQVSRTGRAEPWPHGTPATSPTPNTANTAPKLYTLFPLPLARAPTS